MTGRVTRRANQDCHGNSPTYGPRDRHRGPASQLREEEEEEEEEEKEEDGEEEEEEDEEEEDGC